MIKNKIGSVLKRIISFALIISLLMPTAYTLAVTPITSAVKTTGTKDEDYLVKDDTSKENKTVDKEDYELGEKIKIKWDDKCQIFVKGETYIYSYDWKKGEDGFKSAFIRIWKEQMGEAPSTELVNEMVETWKANVKNSSKSASKRIIDGILGDGAEDLLVAKGKEFIKQSTKRVEQAIDDYCAQIMDSITSPIFKAIGNQIDDSIPVVGSLVADIAKKYVTKQTGWQTKMANEIKKTIGLKVEEDANKKIPEKVDWGYEALDSAFNALGSYSTKLTNDIINQAFDKLFDKFGIGSQGNQVQGALANVVMAYLKPHIDDAINGWKTSVVDKTYGLPAFKKQIDKAKDGKMSIDDVRKMVENNTAISDEYKGQVLDMLKKTDKKEYTSADFEKDLKAKFEETDAAKEIEAQKQKLLKKEKEECEQAEKDMRNEAKKAIDGKLSSKDLAKRQLADAVGGLAAAVANELYGKLTSKLSQVAKNWGEVGSKLAQSVINLGGQITSTIVSNYVSNAMQKMLFKNDPSKMDLKDGLAGIGGRDFWENVGVQLAANVLFGDALSKISEFYLSTVGGFLPSIDLPYEDYSELRYIFMVRSGKLLPCISKASAIKQAWIGTARSLAMGDVGTFGLAEVGRGYHTMQFVPTTDILTESTLGVFKEATKNIPFLRYITIGVPVLMELGTTLQNIVMPSGVIAVLPGNSSNSDSSYIMNEMGANGGNGDSYVQRAFSLSSIAMGNKKSENLNGKVYTAQQNAFVWDASSLDDFEATGMFFTPSYQSAALTIEAYKFMNFTLNTEAAGGFKNAIKDLTTVAKARFDNMQGMFTLGPFKIDYIRDYGYTNGIRPKAEFGLITDMQVFDQNGNIIPRSGWMLSYDEDGNYNHATRKGDEDYMYPYPKEQFYIILSQSMNEDVTSVSRIEISYKELQSTTVATSLGDLTTGINILEFIKAFKKFKILMFISSFIRIPIPFFGTGDLLSVLVTKKFFVNHLQTITLHKKSTGTPGYETAEYTTTSSVKRTGIQNVQVLTGDKLNVALQVSLENVQNTLNEGKRERMKALEDLREQAKLDYIEKCNQAGLTDIDVIKAQDQYKNIDIQFNKEISIIERSIFQTTSEKAKSMSLDALVAAQKSIGNTTAYLQGASFIAQALGQDNIAKGLSVASKLTDTRTSFIGKAAGIYEVLSNDPNAKKIARFASNVDMIVRDNKLRDNQKVIQIINEASGVINNKSFTKIANETTTLLQYAEYGEQVYKLYMANKLGEMTTEEKIAWLKEAYKDAEFMGNLDAYREKQIEMYRMLYPEFSEEVIEALAEADVMVKKDNMHDPNSIINDIIATENRLRSLARNSGGNGTIIEQVLGHAVLMVDTVTKGEKIYDWATNPDMSEREKLRAIASFVQKNSDKGSQNYEIAGAIMDAADLTKDFPETFALLYQNCGKEMTKEEQIAFLKNKYPGISNEKIDIILSNANTLRSNSNFNSTYTKQVLGEVMGIYNTVDKTEKAAKVLKSTVENDKTVAYLYTKEFSSDKEKAEALKKEFPNITDKEIETAIKTEKDLNAQLKEVRATSSEARIVVDATSALVKTKNQEFVEIVTEATKDPVIIQSGKVLNRVIEANTPDKSAEGKSSEEQEKIRKERIKNNRLQVENVAIGYIKEKAEGKSDRDAMIRAVDSTDTRTTVALSLFDGILKKADSSLANALNKSLSTARDSEQLVSILTTYYNRTMDREEKEEFIEVTERTETGRGELFDSTPYTEYVPKFNVKNAERPKEVYYMDDDIMGLTITFAGVVWKDGHSGLEVDFDGVRNANAKGDLEMGIKGVKVTLYKAESCPQFYYYDSQKYPNGPVVGRMRKDEKWVPATTFTDEGGYYHLEEVESGMYYVDFEYDGQTYMATTYLANDYGYSEDDAKYEAYPDLDEFRLNSKALEVNREEFNNKFYEIENGVALDRETVLFNRNKAPIQLEYKRVNGVSKLITRDDETNQVLPDFAMHAVTREAYPIDTSYTLDNVDTQILLKNGQSGATYFEYRRTGEYMYHINLGLIERSKIDAAVTQDVYDIVTTVNQKQETYAYNQRGELNIFDANLKQTETYRNIKYTRDLYTADYQLRLKDYKMNELNTKDKFDRDKTAEIQKIKEIKELQYDYGEGLEERVFITYKITLINQSPLQSICINELADYYDPTFKLVKKDTYQDIQDERGNVSRKLVAKQSFFVVEDDYTGESEEFKIVWEDDVRGSQGGLRKMVNVRTPGISEYGIEDIILNAHNKLCLFITFELDKESDKLSLGTKQNVVEISNYTTLQAGVTSKASSIGLIDKDSEPGNVKVGAENMYEDDTDAAPTVTFRLYSTDLRNIDGYVWNDNRDYEHPLSTGQVIGNGIREKGEELLNGVRVQLVEIIKDPETGTEYEYVWKQMYTGDDGYWYVSSNGVDRGNVVKTETISKNTKTLGTKEKGRYLFHDYPAGNYIVRFIYGDTARTYLAKGSKNTDGVEGNNETSYNGQDYKSTTYLDGTKQIEKWYNLTSPIAQDILASDAKDNFNRRRAVIDYSSTIQNDKAEIMASFDARTDKHGDYYKEYSDTYRYLKDYYNEELHQALRDNTWMFADTAKINVQGEFNKSFADGLENYTYDIKNMDFGLEERPETKLKLTKDIIDITITLASGETIINTARGLNQNVNGTPSQMRIRNRVPGNFYKRDNEKYRETEGKIHIYMDNEIMQGAKVQVTYKITITNESEIDYTGQEKSIGYVYNAGEPSENDRIVTTAVDKIIVYVDNSLTFRQVDSPEWSLIENMQEFTTNNDGTQVPTDKMDEAQFIQLMMRKYGKKYVRNNLKEVQANYRVYLNDPDGKIPSVSAQIQNTYNGDDNEAGVGLTNYKVLLKMQERTTSIGYLNEELKFEKTKSGKTDRAPITQVIVTKALENVKLKPGEEVSVNLVLSKTLSAQDDDDTLTYNNMAEILQYSNTVGRRDMDAIPGNQEPNQYKDEILSDEQKATYERDADFSERIVITPPTGANKAIYIVLPLVILIVLAGGIVLIKRKVLGKK